MGMKNKYKSDPRSYEHYWASVVVNRNLATLQSNNGVIPAPM